jgi:hypothetical protein
MKVFVADTFVNYVEALNKTKTVEGKIIIIIISQI